MFTPTSIGGHARYTYELLSALSSRSAAGPVDVSLVTSANLDPAFRATSYPIHPILPVLSDRESFRSRAAWAASRLSFYWRRDREFIRWAVANRVAAVHFQEFTPWTAPLDIRRLRRHGVRVLATVHNITWNDTPPLMPHWLPRVCNRRAWRTCDALFVHSASLKQELGAFLGSDHPPIVVYPHGVWSSSPIGSATAEIEQRRRRRQLLFFGVVTPYKGVEVLIEALGMLPEYSLVVAGAPDDAAYMGRLRECAASLPVGQVRFDERFLPEAEIAPLFGESSLLVLPYTRFTSQSGVLHDAVANGMPVVGTDVGAIGETIRSWGLGAVTPPGNAEALALAIREAMEPAAYSQAVHAGGAYRDATSWQAAADIVLDTYERVIRG